MKNIEIDKSIRERLSSGVLGELLEEGEKLLRKYCNGENFEAYIIE